MEKDLQVKKKRVAVYCRVSTAADQQDGSFERQCEYFRAIVAANPTMLLVDIYGDHGKSGRSMAGRPALQRLLRDCTAGKIDLILTKSVSRFARNLADCVGTVRALQSMGISVLFEKEALNTGDERNELFLCILATMAQQESNSIASHVAWARRQRAMAGCPYGEVAYGYLAGRRHKHIWHTVEDEARRVRRAFDMANRGECYKDIRAALQSMEDTEQTGKVWSQFNLGYLLRNPCYKGDYIVNKTCQIPVGSGWRKVWNNGQREQFYIEEHHEALVSDKVFQRVQLLMRRGLLNSNKQNFSDTELALLKKVV